MKNRNSIFKYLFISLVILIAKINFVSAKDLNLKATEILTFDQEESGERVEGKVSDVITLSGTPWFGGGIIWDFAEDLSSWSTLIVAVRSDATALDDFDISMQYEIAGSLSVKDVKVAASSYGYVNDGEWHVLEIPMQDLIDLGLQPTTVRSPFVFAKEGGNAGDQLSIDSLFLQ